MILRVDQIFNISNDYCNTKFSIEFNFNGRQCHEDNVILTHARFDKLDNAGSELDMTDFQHSDFLQSIVAYLDAH